MSDRARRGGRPRISADAPGVTVSTVLPERVTNRLQAIAERDGVSVSAALRRIVVFSLKEVAAPPRASSPDAGTQADPTCEKSPAANSRRTVS